MGSLFFRNESILFVTCYVAKYCYLCSVWMSKIRRDNFKLSFHTFKGGFGHLFIFLIQSLLFHSFASPLQRRNHSFVFVYYIALLTYVWCSVQAHTPAADRKKRRRGSKGGKIKKRHCKFRSLHVFFKTPTCENPHRSLCKESNNFSKHKKS